MSDTIQKSLLGISGEYSVAAELAKRNIYAQLTLGNQKRTDLLIFSEKSNKFLKVEVKCKQSVSWPNCKGINDNQSVIVFVDFQKVSLSHRPKFYVLANEDWAQLMTQKLEYYRQRGRNVEIVNNHLVFIDQKIKNNGKNYEGCPVTLLDVNLHSERWDKIMSQLDV